MAQLLGGDLEMQSADAIQAGELVTLADGTFAIVVGHGPDGLWIVVTRENVWRAEQIVYQVLAA